MVRAVKILISLCFKLGGSDPEKVRKDSFEIIYETELVNLGEQNYAKSVSKVLETSGSWGEKNDTLISRFVIYRYYCIRKSCYEKYYLRICQSYLLQIVVVR